MRSPFRPIVGVLTVGLLLAAGAAPARAATIYAGQLDTALTFVAVRGADGGALPGVPAGLEVMVYGFKFQSTATVGGGFATASVTSSIPLIDFESPDGPAPPEAFALGQTLTTTEVGNGGTLAVGDFAESVAAVILFVEVFNSTDQPLTLDFEQTYTYAIASLVDDPAAEYAFSLAGLGVFDRGSEDSLLNVYDRVEYTASSGGTGGRAFSTTVDPGGFGGLTAIYYIHGDPFSPAAVPEPASAVLAGVGLLAAGVMRRRVRGGRGA